MHAVADQMTNVPAVVELLVVAGLRIDAVQLAAVDRVEAIAERRDRAYVAPRTVELLVRGARGVDAIERPARLPDVEVLAERDYVLALPAALDRVFVCAGDRIDAI